MTTTIHDPRRLADEALLARLRALVVRSNQTEAELLVHLAEVDERRLYLPEHTSLFAFCTTELGFSEAAAEHRIAVARAARRFPKMLEMLARGRMHLSGLRVLVPHLTDNCADTLLALAAGKSKRAIEEIIACHAPRPPIADSIRKLPERSVAAAPSATPDPLPLLAGPPSPAPEARRPGSIAPLAPEQYHVQLTASRKLRDKIDQARALLRHQVPNGDLATIFDRALDALIAQAEKQRFAVGRKPRSSKLPEGPAKSHDVPDALKRAVYERDGGKCTFVSPSGKRCEERGLLQIDHVNGFARRQEHTLDGLRLLCASHNQYSADVMYGRAFMANKRGERAKRTHPGDGSRSGAGAASAAALVDDRAPRRQASAGRQGGGEEAAGPAEVPPDP